MAICQKHTLLYPVHVSIHILPVNYSEASSTYPKLGSECDKNHPERCQGLGRCLPETGQIDKLHVEDDICRNKQVPMSMQ